MPPITTTETMCEREEGKKKETLGVATYGIYDSIHFDLDRYLETMVFAEVNRPRSLHDGWNRPWTRHCTICTPN